MSARAEAMRELARRIRSVLYLSHPTHSEKHGAIQDLAVLEVHALTAEEQASTRIMPATGANEEDAERHDDDEARETNSLSAFVANAIMRRFDLKLNRPSNDISKIVYLAAEEVMQTVFGRSTNPISALDEIEDLEAALQERAT